jgi:hypothetical protein
VTLLRRLFIILLVLAVPPLLTAGLYYGTLYGLAATNRTVDPHLLIVFSCVEFAAFFIVMLFDARARW